MTNAASMDMTTLRLSEGVWESMLTCPHEVPALMAHAGDTRLDPPIIEAHGPGTWLVRVDVPPSVISDGTQVFTISIEETREKLSSFAVIAGDALRDDLRAEVALLRAELDMLKRAFRRHCTETGQG